MSVAYGRTLDGRGHFDIEPGDTPEAPALRRVASPIEVSDAYLDATRTSSAVDAAAQLIGPNVEFNNSKINSKQPGAATEVKFHQDFMFQPHSNEDLIAVLFFIDDVTPENGPLEVVPSTHHDSTLPVHGPAGAACLMHTRLLHGSAPNRIRCSPYEMQYPEVPGEASFFAQQAKADGRS
jgi:ectoine hydroxylase-related dioxygenase (phytanoyl-CoA dioxygenase family)